MALSDQQRPEVMAQLKKAGGFFELYEVIGTFRGYRNAKSGGGVQEVTVEIWEAEHGAPYRYVVKATDDADPERRATGNGGDRLDVAIATTHWGNLDK